MASTSASNPPYDPCHKLVCEPKKVRFSPFKCTSDSPFTKEVPVVISPTESVMWPKTVAVVGYGTNKPFDQVTQLHTNYFV